MPNAMRAASIFAELSTLGYQQPMLKVLELGAGPASGITGMLAASNLHLFPSPQHIALIDQEQSMLNLGASWLRRLYQKSIRCVKHDMLKENFLPEKAPRFDCIIMSYSLNELALTPENSARMIETAIKRHLTPKGIFVIIEPALRSSTRRLLEMRSHLKAHVLLPCMGNHPCGALRDPDDWCHEDISWWRPESRRILDELMHHDHKNLPFSYLVLAQSPLLALPQKVTRIVSNCQKKARDCEFYLCTPEGKRRVRTRFDERLERGSILASPHLRGDPASTRLEPPLNFIPSEKPAETQ